MTTLRYCQARVPDALRGNLRVGTCVLLIDANGQHAGDHKALYSVPRMGRVTFRWKTIWRRAERAPVVALPTPEWGSRAVPRDQICECPPWKTGHLHCHPCKLMNR